MSYTSNYNLNQRLTYLEWEIGKIAPIPVGGYDLENVLTIGNNAGANDIDLNSQDILNGENVEVNTLTNSSYKLNSQKPIYQELNSSSNWNNVNGYYGLAKDAYPALNPNSCGEEAVSTWTSRSAAAGNQWVDICWSPKLSLFAAISYTGTGNRIMTSPDGINWATTASPANYEWGGVVWSPELSLFVSVSRTGTNTERAMYSTDGVVWILGVTPNDTYSWQYVCWSPELRLFIAVAQSGGTNSTQRVMSSTDGINWTLQNFGITRQWSSVCWSAELGLFCAVAFSGTGNRVITSPDGITWTPQVSATDNNWRSVVWSKEVGLFVAVSATGTGDRIMTSPDGITWTSQVSPVDNQWRSIVYSPELSLFVSVASTGTGDRIMTSPNAVNWTIRTNPEDNSWNSVTWSAELGVFVSVAGDGTNRVMMSNLAGRPPTSFNVFNSDFNSIDNNGFWTINVPYSQYINTGTQALSASTATDITLNTTVVENGTTRVGNVISFNRAGVYKVGVSLLIEDSAGSADFYFSFTDNNGVVANSSSVMEIPSNTKTLGYAEIIYTATASSTIKVVAYTTSANLSITTYASPDPAIAVSPAIIMTIYKIK